MGGLIAYEMARQLTEDGEEVGQLLLIDTPSPSACAAVPSADALLSWFLEDLQLGLDLSTLDLTTLPPPDAEDGGVLRLQSALNQLVVGGQLPEGIDAIELMARLRVFSAAVESAATYRPTPLDLAVTLLRATIAAETGFHTSSQETATPDWGWASLASSVDVSWIESTHLTLLGPEAAPLVACHLRRAADVTASAMAAAAAAASSGTVEGDAAAEGLITLLTAAEATEKIRQAKLRISSLPPMANLQPEAMLSLVQATGLRVDMDTNLADAGMDSFAALKIRNGIARCASVALPTMLVFENPTARSLSAAVLKLTTVQAKKPGTVTHATPQRGLSCPPSVRDAPIVLKATACQLPGRITSMDMLAKAALTSSDLTSEVPFERWDIDNVADGMEPDIQTRLRFGSFVMGADLFDHQRFGLSRVEAGATDPQQRLLLEHSLLGLQRAGQEPRPGSASTVGVAVGIHSMEFKEIMLNRNALGKVYAMATDLSVASGRVSFALGLQGPCSSIDAACAAFLVASHASMRALQFGECETHLALGVNMTLLQSSNACAAMVRMTSLEGHCHTFDHRADGYCRGEGISAAVLKPGAGAGELRLEGSAVRQDGRSASLTAPNGSAQQKLYRAALADAGTTADAIALYEAHGTGTPLGDPVETGSLAGSVLKSRSPDTPPLPLGAIKGCFGHGETQAAGTGVLSLMLGLQSSTKVANAQLRVPNPFVADALRNAPCDLSTQSGPVRSHAKGAISSFGYSGTIAHMILADPDDDSEVAPVQLPLARRWRRRSLPWVDLAQKHPMLQRRLPSLEDETIFRSVITPLWLETLADHRVAGTIITPAACQVEMAHTTYVAASGGKAWGALVTNTNFMAPSMVNDHEEGLLEEEKLMVECVLVGEDWRVRSSLRTAEPEWTVHSEGKVRAPSSLSEWPQQSAAQARMMSAHALDMPAFYRGSANSHGVQLLKGFQVIAKIWAQEARGQTAGLVKPRMHSHGTRVHPADLDSLLVLSIARSATEKESPLPFSLVEAQLRQVPSAYLRSNTARYTLISPPPPPEAKLAADAFMCTTKDEIFAYLHQLKVRQLKMSVGKPAGSFLTTALYTTEWRHSVQPDDAEEAPAGAPTALLVIGAGTGAGRAETIPYKRIVSDLAVGTAIVFAMGAQPRCHNSLFVLEAAVSLLQAQVASEYLPTVWLLTHGAQTEAQPMGRNVPRPMHASLWGLARSVRAELSPPLLCIDAAQLPSVSDRGNSTEPEVVVTGAGDMLPRLKRAVVKETPDTGASNTHVVTGGTNGLGLLTGRWLAQRGAAMVVLASRSGALARDGEAEWAAMQSSGAETVVARCDAGERAHVARLAAHSPSLAGIWHAAGVVSDALLPQQEAAGICRVYAPKVHGSRALHAAASAAALHACVLFSSAAALLGGAGQANYSAANASLDALAVCRRALGLNASSPQFVAWAEMGMASKGAAAKRMEQMEAASGVGRIWLKDGLSSLWAATQADAPAVMGVMPVEWNKMLSGGVPIFLEAFAPKGGLKKKKAAAGDEAGGAGGMTLEEVMELVERVAGMDIDLDVPLMEAGLDSLGAVELRNQLQDAAGKTLPSLIAFDHPTVRALAGVLAPQQEVKEFVLAEKTEGSTVGQSFPIGGMDARIPGGVSSTQAFHKLIVTGADAIGEVPAALIETAHTHCTHSPHTLTTHTHCTSSLHVLITHYPYPLHRYLPFGGM